LQFRRKFTPRNPSLPFLFNEATMHPRSICLLLTAVMTLSASAVADDWEALFDGKTLNGWDGDPQTWSVQDGAITGKTYNEEGKKLKRNTFIVWRGGEVDNFELELEYKIVNGNSGIQYRSFELPDAKWGIGGYQADFEAGDTYSGILYGEQYRGILALRGESTELVRTDGKFEKKVTGSVGDTKEIQQKIRKEDWNTYRIVADGYHFQHFINDVKTVDVTDSDLQERRAAGLLALQAHTGPAMTVQFRNIRLKRLPAPKKVALIAGKPSHGYGAHEHRAGCMLLAEALNSSGLGIEATVYTNGWPEDDSVLDHADSIVIYADGGNGHPFNSKLDRLNALQKRGIGMVCIHYGVEVPKGPSGEAFLNWTGGYFETDWSVNPHWTASFTKFPQHPIANGVKPFRINDEWYYHMRFAEDAELINVLTDLPPTETLVKEDGSLTRPEGPHSNNPAVRAAVLERKESQTVAWARTRKDAGRGFGFTGGHDHWNWGNRDFRTLVLNAIVWTAHGSVPADGVASKDLAVTDLQTNQDYEVPANFNPARIQAMLDEWSSARK
jgi:type 1 glutamine amidotransferase